MHTVEEKGSAEPSSRRKRPLAAIVIIFTVCMLILVGAGGVFWWLNMQPHQASHHHHRDSNEVPVSGERSTESQEIATQYMSALLNGKYDTMWHMLHPQVQAMWPGEAAFARFWRVRFHDYHLLGFALGKVRGLIEWTNPETMVTYPQVILVPISLQLTLDPSLQSQANIPPEDLDPGQAFEHLPFIIQQSTSPHTLQTRWLVLDGGPADLEAPILPPLHPVHTMVEVPILMYHHISNTIPPGNLLELSLTVTPAHFAQQLDYLKEQDYHTITFNQLFDALYYGGPLPAHPIILTFDDGYQDVYTFALPLLRAHGFSGMFYIITGVVGWRGYMNWDEIRTMLTDGMQIGSHTIHHVNVGSLWLLSPERAQAELEVSRGVLQRNLGILIQQFCYPSGEPFRSGSLVVQEHIVALLAADGYVGATTDPGRTGVYQNSITPFELLRIRVDGRESLLGFTQSLPWDIKKLA